MRPNSAASADCAFDLFLFKFHHINSGIRHGFDDFFVMLCLFFLVEKFVQHFLDTLKTQKSAADHQ